LERSLYFIFHGKGDEKWNWEAKNQAGKEKGTQPDLVKSLIFLVELRGVEPLTS